MGSPQANIELPLEEDVGRGVESELFAALKKRYPHQAYALLSHVSNATGGKRSRIADALAMGLWPSRGIELHGFELKRTRDDWIGELRNPAKADEFTKFCHRWWLVVAHDAVVQPGELPPNWGLLILRARGGLECATEAPLLTPEPLTIFFVAAVLRRVQDSYVPKDDIVRLLRKERQDTIATERQSLGHQLQWLKNQVAAFEKASGVKVDASGWDGGDIGEAVHLVLENRGLLMRRYLNDLREQTRAALATLDAMDCALAPEGEKT